MNIKLIKIIGIGATLLGAGASLVASWAGEKQQEATIAEKVASEVQKYLAPVAEAAAETALDEAN